MQARGKRRLRWLIWSAVGLAVALVFGYRHVADPVRLRAKALATLQSVAGDTLEIGDISFSIWSGLQITDLVIPAAGRAVPRGYATNSPPLHIAQARIQCGLVGLLGGRLEPTRIDVSQVTLTILCDAGAGARREPPSPLDAGSRRLWQRLRGGLGRLPVINVSQADVQLMAVEHDRPRLLERRLLRVEGRPTAAGYTVRLERLPSLTDLMAEVRCVERTGDIEVMLDWTKLETIRPLLPPRLRDALGQLDFSGRVRAERCVFRMRAAAVEGGPPAPTLEPPTALAALELRLADLSFAIQLEDELAGPRAAGAGSARAFLQVTDATATAGYRSDDPNVPGQLALRIDGRLNGAPLAGTLEVQATPAAILGLQPGDERANADIPSLRFDDVRTAEMRVDGIELPTLATDAAFLHATGLPNAVRHAFVDYQPQGRVNLRLRLRPPDSAEEAAAARVEAEIEPLGAACTYSRFPYAFHDAWGRVRVVGGRILLEGLCAWHGSARVCGDGVVNDSQEWTGFELTFRGENVPLDGDLYAALPPEQRTLWRSAAPTGLCDVVTTMRRAEGSRETGPLQPDVQVDARLLGGSLSLGPRGRLDGADGRLAVHGGMVDVQDLHGYQGDASVRLSGRVWADGDTPQSDLRVEVADLPLEQRATLGPADDGAAQEVRFRGRADAWGRVYNTGSLSETREQFAAHIKDGELRTLDPARTWTRCEGWAIAEDGRQKLLQFTAWQGDARLDASGVVPVGAAAAQPLSLDLRARGALDEVLPQFAPGPWRDIVQAVGLSGPGDVRLALTPGSAAGAAAQQMAEIQVSASRMRARPLPLDLTDVTAHVVLQPGRFDVPSAAGRWGAAGKLEAFGRGSWQGDAVDFDFNLAARNLRFCPELNAALPAPARELLTALSLRGEFDALLPHVVWHGGTPRTWRIEGRVPLRDAEIQLGLHVTGLQGELTGACTGGPDDDVEIEAQLAVQQGQLDGRPIAGWQGRLRRHRDTRWVTLDELGGRLCDGDALGVVQIDPQTSEYELSLTLRDVSLHQLFPPRDPTQPERPGWLGGTVYLRGRGSEATMRRGGGEVRIRGASFLRTPLLASLLRAGPRGHPAINDTVEQADVRFVWEGSQIELVRVDIQSPDLRLVGEGTWDMHSDALQMTLLGASPQNWPRLAMVTDLLELAGKELIQYRVRGTLAAPIVTAEPLHKLNDALRKLLKGGEP